MTSPTQKDASQQSGDGGDHFELDSFPSFAVSQSQDEGPFMYSSDKDDEKEIAEAFGEQQDQDVKDFELSSSPNQENGDDTLSVPAGPYVDSQVDIKRLNRLRQLNESHGDLGDVEEMESLDESTQLVRPGSQLETQLTQPAHPSQSQSQKTQQVQEPIDQIDATQPVQMTPRVGKLGDWKTPYRGVIADSPQWTQPISDSPTQPVRGVDATQPVHETPATYRFGAMLQPIKEHENDDAVMQVTSTPLFTKASGGDSDPTPVDDMEAIQSGDEEEDHGDNKKDTESPRIIQDTVVRLNRTQPAPHLAHGTPTRGFKSNSEIVRPPKSGERAIRRVQSDSDNDNDQPAQLAETKSVCGWVHWQDGRVYPVKVIESNEGPFSGRLDKNARLDVIFGPDGREGEIAKSSLFALDVGEDDQVKVQDDKKEVYRVLELVKLDKEAPISSAGTNDSTGDGLGIETTSGHEHVRIGIVDSSNRRKKSKREPRVVAVSELYMTTKLWTKYRERREGPHNVLQEQMTSPMESRTRTKTMTINGDGSGGEFGYREDSGSGPEPIVVSKVFEGCVFSVTMEEDTAVMTRAIEQHGGVVVTQGFRELMDGFSDINVDAHVRELRFAGVIAKGPKRTFKYLEGLALGWPCLSRLFIDDCIAEQQLVDWGPYLLSAGTSDVLDNAPCSQDVWQFRANWSQGMSLSEQFERRRRVLESVGVDIYLMEPPRSQARDDSVDFIKLLVEIAKGADTRVHRVDRLEDVPEGSIVVENFDNKHSRTGQSLTKDRQALHSVQNGSSNRTVVYNRQWVIQCIINRRIV
uniref:ARAD1A07106p n=1 Tax=Blastobotrys adeninivorans TaxID=409370 RepID=A0A060SXT2_BLAAD